MTSQFGRNGSNDIDGVTFSLLFDVGAPTSVLTRGEREWEWEYVRGVLHVCARNASLARVEGEAGNRASFGAVKMNAAAGDDDSDDDGVKRVIVFFRWREFVLLFYSTRVD